MRRILKQVIHLIRIRVKVIQLPHIPRAQRQLPPVRRNDAAARQGVHPVDARAPQKPVRQLIACPVPLNNHLIVAKIGIPPQRRRKALALQMRRRLLPHQIQQRRHEVYLTCAPLQDSPLPRQPRNPHRQRHPRRLLIERPLLQHPMIARHLPVFACEHHHGVVSNPRPIQRRRDLAHHPVHQRDVGEILSPQPAPPCLSSQIMPRRRIMRHIRVLRRIAPLIQVLRIEVAPNPIVQRRPLRPLQKRRPHRQLRRIVHIVQRPIIRRMRLECAHIQREWLIAVALYEISRPVRQKRRHLMLLRQPRAQRRRKDELARHTLQVRLMPVGYEIMPVVAEHIAILPPRIFRQMPVLRAHPLVKPVLPYHIIAQMPLAVVAAVILVRQHLSDNRNVPRHNQLVHRHPRRMRIHPRHYGSPRRRAYRLRHICVLEHKTLIRQRVQIRHIQPIVPIASHRVRPLLIAEYENQVRPVRHITAPHCCMRRNISGCAKICQSPKRI